MCQFSNTHGWHGARRMARANEQQEQKQRQQQQQKKKQKKAKQQAKQQQQQNCGETRVSSLSPTPAGALSVAGVKARTPPFARKTSSDTALCWLSLLLTRQSLDCAQDGLLVESAKGKAAVGMPDSRRRRHAESKAVEKSTEGAARRSKLAISDVKQRCSWYSLTTSSRIYY